MNSLLKIEKNSENQFKYYARNDKKKKCAKLYVYVYDADVGFLRGALAGYLELK